MGDYNAYSEEDPLDVLRAAGLIGLLAADEHTHSYQATHGALDHAFGTGALESLVTGAHVWHINSDEPNGFDYADENISRYQPNAFGCSDHDPLLVGFSATPVGLVENDATTPVRVIQNDRSVIWSAGGTSSFGVALYDACGTLLRLLPASSGSVSADLSGLSSGLLLWRLVGPADGGGIAVGRLVLP
jgi:hypothetical protein